MKARGLALWLFLPVVIASGSSGYPECPCITNSSAKFTQYENALIAGGIRPTYGITGCAAHDSNYSLFGCEQNQESFCQNPWCLVDMDLCPYNRQLCEDAGGTIGSDVSPHCRTRGRNPSSLLNISDMHYSYETCDSVNDYDPQILVEPVVGRMIRAAADAWAPWIVKTTNSMNEEVWGGPSFDFLKASLDQAVFDPKPVLEVVPGWATQQSRDKYPESSYTACVHDVAIGNFDICIADLWLTPERNQLTTFLPAVRQDYFYLMVKTGSEGAADLTLWQRLAKPFEPFTPGAWGAVVGFLCIMSVLLWLRQVCETGCHGDAKTICKTNVVALLRSLFFVWHDFLLGQSSMDVESGPVRQIFSLALAFFILITLASYTASLASVLVIQNTPSASINSIEDAINDGQTICAPTSLIQTFTGVYPQAVFVAGDIQTLPRMMLHAGQCDVMVLSQDVIDRVFAGKVREADCAAFHAGTMTQEEAQCWDGDEQRDCSFLKVGDLLWSVPLSFPINDAMAHSLSWAFTYAITGGVMEDAKRSNSELFAESICAAEADEQDIAMSFDDLSGVMFISFFIVGVGFVVMAARHFQRQRRKSVGDENPEEEMVAEVVEVTPGDEPSVIEVPFPAAAATFTDPDGQAGMATDVIFTKTV
ncbi:unnamed protein product [Symbiodinium sp. CCMP2592]|nr:unnamed protein product [Symbiodinium sp. CCMP2592]